MKEGGGVEVVVTVAVLFITSRLGTEARADLRRLRQSGVRASTEYLWCGERKWITSDWAKRARGQG